MQESQTVKAGDLIQVDYTGRFEDGTVFETSVKKLAFEAGIYDEEKEYIPLFFRVKAGQVIKGLDEGVLGMKVGDKKTLLIPPKDAYGEHRDYLVQKVPLSKLGLKFPPKAGEMLMTPGGREVKVLASTETHATLDFNHGLAGKTLSLDVKLLSIEGQGYFPE